MKNQFLIICFLFAGVHVFAQDVTVTGKIVDESHQTLPGVAVLIVEDPTSGVSSGLDGEYAIKARPGQTLRFSMMGFWDVDVKVDRQKTIDVTLIENVNVLEEAVATGYSSVSKKNLTTAIAKVEADKVNKVATSNMSQLLFGRAAGLQATMSSAQPGGGVNISVRGGGNLYMSLTA